MKKNFSDHLILGEEGGIIGDTSSDYLWCIDPLGFALFANLIAFSSCYGLFFFALDKHIYNL